MEKHIVLRTLAPASGADTKQISFETDLVRRYPFTANGLVMAVACAKSIFNQGHARGMDLSFSYAENDERVMPMVEFFDLMDQSYRCLANYASCVISDEEIRRREEGRTAMVLVALGWLLNKFPDCIVVMNGGEGTRDLLKLRKEFEAADLTDDEEDAVSIFVGNETDGIVAAINLRNGSEDSDLEIFESWTTNLDPAISLANEVKQAYALAA